MAILRIGTSLFFNSTSSWSCDRSRAVEDLALEVLDLVVDLVERREEAVGEGVQDLVDDNALGCAGPAPQMLDQLFEHLAALVVQGHDVAAADHHAHLDRLEVARDAPPIPK